MHGFGYPMPNKMDSINGTTTAKINMAIARPNKFLEIDVSLSMPIIIPQGF